MNVYEYYINLRNLIRLYGQIFDSTNEKIKKIQFKIFQNKFNIFEMFLIISFVPKQCWSILGYDYVGGEHRHFETAFL